MQIFRKAVITGVTGRNGFATLLKLSHFSEIVELVGMVRKPEQIENIKARLSAHDEGEESHPHITPIITNDEKAIKGAHVFINWQGVNVETLKKNNPNLEKEAEERGMHLRDMLLEGNLKIAIANAKLALKHAKDCIFMQQGNPVDVLVRAVYKEGFNEGKVISTGALMEYYRFTKLFAQEFPNITLNRATGMYIGEHGENAVPLKENISVGGVPIEEYVKTVDSKEGPRKLAEIYDRVNTEAFWIREKTGQTPSEGPAAVTANVVRMILNPQKETAVGICCYVKKNVYYNLDDIAISVPVLLGRNGVSRIMQPILNLATLQAFSLAVKHIKKMNQVADKIK